MTGLELTGMISGDSHLEIDAKAWVNRIPEKYQLRAPRVVPLSDGSDAWLIEGSPLRDVTDSVFAGEDRDQWMPFRHRYEGSAGTGSAQQRVSEQDQDGISGEVLFPGSFGPAFWYNIRHESCYLAIVRAYNSFLAEEYCSAAPDRLFGVGVVPWTGVADAEAEMAFCHEVGLKAVVLGVYPNGTMTPAPEDDRFWSSALERGMGLTIHNRLDNGRSGEIAREFIVRDTSERAKRSLPNFEILTDHVSADGRAGALNAMQLALTGVFDRFPALELFFAENQIGSIPHFLEQADAQFHRHARWVERELGWSKVQRLPSEYARDNCLWGFNRDRVGVELRHKIGVGRLIWSTNFPHLESDWPMTSKAIQHDFEDVPLDEVHLMTRNNVLKFLGS